MNTVSMRMLALEVHTSHVPRSHSASRTVTLSHHRVTPFLNRIDIVTSSITQVPMIAPIPLRTRHATISIRAVSDTANDANLLYGFYFLVFFDRFPLFDFHSRFSVTCCHFPP